MNNLKEDGGDDEFYTIEEPSISYYSSSINRGVSTLLTSRERYPIKIKDIFKSSFSFNNSFSLYNTIMLPSIKKENEIIEKNKIIINIKEKGNNQVSIVKDKTSNNTLSSNTEIKENEDINQQKGDENKIKRNK